MYAKIGACVLNRVSGEYIALCDFGENSEVSLCMIRGILQKERLAK